MGPGRAGPDVRWAGDFRAFVEALFELERELLLDLLGEDPRVRVDVREAIEVSVPSQTINPQQSHASRVSQIPVSVVLMTAFDPNHNRHDHGATSMGGSHPFANNLAGLL